MARRRTRGGSASRWPGGWRGGRLPSRMHRPCRRLEGLVEVQVGLVMAAQVPLTVRVEREGEAVEATAIEAATTGCGGPSFPSSGIAGRRFQYS